MKFVTPDFVMPQGGLNIRLGDTPVAQEARMIDYKRFAAEAFARANRIDRRVHGRAGARIGLVAAGKNWLDLVHALSLLGIDAAEADRLGITTYKVGPDTAAGHGQFPRLGRGARPDHRGRGEAQADRGAGPESIFDDRRGRRVLGWHHDRTHEELFPTRFARWTR